MNCCQPHTHTHTHTQTNKHICTGNVHFAEQGLSPGKQAVENGEREGVSRMQSSSGRPDSLVVAEAAEFCLTSFCIEVSDVG